MSKTDFIDKIRNIKENNKKDEIKYFTDVDIPRIKEEIENRTMRKNHSYREEMPDCTYLSHKEILDILNKELPGFEISIINLPVTSGFGCSEQSFNSPHFEINW
jgi:hypothetical protein